MGTSFLPIAASHQLAGWLSGGTYEGISDKLFLLRKEVMHRGIQLPEISDQFTKNDFFNEAANHMGMSSVELTSYLWQTYHPSDIWILYSGIAVFATVLLWLYDRFIIGK